jgi:AraC-like DNA-binding protein
MLRYRLNPSPSLPLPLNVRSAGHYRFAPTHQEKREPGSFLQVFWSVSGSGRFKAGKRIYISKPGDVFYYAAEESHELTAGPLGWEYRWLTFDGPHFTGIVDMCGLNRVQTAGPCPVDLFEELDVALRNPTPNGESRASVLAYEIMIRAVSPRTGEDPAVPVTRDALAAKNWIDSHFTDARLNITALCNRLGIHRSSLHRMFARSYGIAPVQYLGRLRLRLALELLTDTRLPVADVAVRCGLPDAAYFSKQVARHTGYSPRVYRQRHAHRSEVTSSSDLPASAKSTR